MSQPFVGEIRMFGFNFAPKSWAFCNGQLQSIAQNTALFSILGTTYGGDGRVTYGLPNLQGSAAIHEGQGPGLSNYDLGQIGGSTQVTLNPSQLPLHNHNAMGSTNPADQAAAPGNVWAGRSGRGAVNLFSSSAGSVMSPQSLGLTGGGQPHDNMPPYQVVNFCICLFGIFPSRN